MVPSAYIAESLPNLPQPSGSRSQRRLIPSRTSQRPTVAMDTTSPRPLNSSAIRLAVHFSRRICATRARTSWLEDRCGTLARSAWPASPSPSNRDFHFDRHCREIPASAATWAIGAVLAPQHQTKPAGTVQQGMSARPDGSPWLGCVGRTSHRPRSPPPRHRPRDTRAATGARRGRHIASNVPIVVYQT